MTKTKSDYYANFAWQGGYGSFLKMFNVDYDERMYLRIDVSPNAMHEIHPNSYPNAMHWAHVFVPFRDRIFRVCRLEKETA